MIESILSPETYPCLGLGRSSTPSGKPPRFSILLAVLLLAMRRYSALSRYVVAICVLSVFLPDRRANLCRALPTERGGHGEPPSVRSPTR